MRLFDRLKSWLRPDPADALKGAENDVLPTPQHPNNQPLADPSSSEDAAPVPDDLHDV